MLSILTFGLLAIAGLSTAQEQYNIDPTSVKPSLRDYWCDQQKEQCPLICLQQPGVKTSNTINNDCYTDTLTFKCTCDNNVSPNITQYTQTLPYFICTEWGNQCVKKCSGDNSCESACREDHPCGAQDPPKPNVTSSSLAGPTASKTGGGDSSAPTSGFLGQSAAPGAAPVTMDMSALPVMAISFIGIFAGFSLL